MTVVYDNTFEGFLTLVYEVYYKKLKIEKIEKSMPNTLFDDEIYEVKTDKLNAQKVFEAIKKRFPKKAISLILNTFMCDTREFELDLLRYIIIGFKDKRELFNINDSSVFYLSTLEKEFFRHHHKMTAFVRFKELEDGTLYAKINSKFNVVYHLGKHFFKRLNNQNYIIHDISRKVAFVKNNDNLSIENVADFEEPSYSKEEDKFEKLWCTFFEAVSIKERKNEKVQKNYVPLIYREYMTEFL